MASGVTLWACLVGKPVLSCVASGVVQRTGYLTLALGPTAERVGGVPGGRHGPGQDGSDDCVLDIPEPAAPGRVHPPHHRPVVRPLQLGAGGGSVVIIIIIIIVPSSVLSDCELEVGRSSSSSSSSLSSSSSSSSSSPRPSSPGRWRWGVVRPCRGEEVSWPLKGEGGLRDLVLW
jgi:hypothetical protein